MPGDEQAEGVPVTVDVSLEQFGVGPLFAQDFTSTSSMPPR